ncbi:MAG: hypothetical protein ISN64_03425 [Rickettsia sp.]|nr:hypothetical protein [Rickettsia sp.]
MIRKKSLAMIVIFLILCFLIFYYSSDIKKYFFSNEIFTIGPEYTQFKIKPNQNKDLKHLLKKKHEIPKSKEVEPILSFENFDQIDYLLDKLYLFDDETSEIKINLAKFKRHKFKDHFSNNSYIVELGFFDNLLELEYFKEDFKKKYESSKEKINFIVKTEQNAGKNFFILNVGKYDSLQKASNFCYTLLQNDLLCIAKEE